MFLACDLFYFFIPLCLQAFTIFLIELHFVEWLFHGRQSLCLQFCNCCQELLQVNWLLQKTSRADMQCKLPILSGDIGSRDKYYGNVARLGIYPQPVNQPKAIKFWHHNVSDNDSRALGLNDIQRILAIMS